MVEKAVSGRSPQALAVAGRSWLAAVLGGLVLALAAASVALSVLIHRLSAGSIAVGGVVVLTFAGVGLLIARRRPGNPVGWIMVVFSLAYVLGAAASYYAALYYRLGHRGLPLAPAALLLGTVQAPSFAVFPLAIVLFPDGQLTRRWRRVMWAYVALAAVVLAVFFLAAAAAAIAGHDVRVGPGGNLTTSGQLAGWLANPPGWLAVPVIGSILVIGFSFVGRQVLSWRGAEGDRRQQLKWLAFGAAVACASLILAAVLGIAALLAGLAALPASIGIGILKYRLYDLDRIVSRTLAYAVVTGLLVGVYAGLVLLSTHVLSLKSPVAVAAATLVAAALFNPVRRRVQRAVDRRFNRARYNTDLTVAAFAARLKDAADLDSVREDLAGVVQHALEPAHISVWMNERR
jgi:MFS family permease